MPEKSKAAKVAVTLSPTGLPGATREFLDLVGVELRHGGQGAGAQLAADPARWLGALGALLHNAREQRAARDAVFEAELKRPVRSVTWETDQREYYGWRRKALHYESAILVRLASVRRLLPEDDLVLLLESGTTIDPVDIDAVRTWQAKAARVLSTRARGEESAG